MKKILSLSFILCIFTAGGSTLLTTGCATLPEKPEGKAVLSAQVTEAVVAFKAKDLSISRFFAQSYGYAVFPKVFKGGFIAGGAYGQGLVFEQGRMAGYSSLQQATLGFSFGGEFFREIIFFRQKPDLDKFKREEFAFTAQATGVAISEGVAAKADYKDGMAVFVMPEQGLMVDASLGGQKFNFISSNIQ